jgi:hypothetical protein
MTARRHQITQAEIAETVSLFESVLSRLRDFRKRGGSYPYDSVEPGRLSLDVPILAEDIEIIAEQFREFVPQSGRREALRIARRNARVNARIEALNLSRRRK